MNSPTKKIAKEINLKEIFFVIKKRLWILIFITVLATLAGFAYGETKTTTLLYQSSTRLIIGADSELMKTLQVIIKDSTVLEKVVGKLKLNRSSEALANQINVESLDSSKVVSINVIDTDPKRAADIANTTAEVFKNEIPNILGFNDVRILSPAKVHTNPINEEGNKAVNISLLFGIFAGIGLVFLLDSMDDTVKSEKDVEEYLSLPVLGRISKMNKKNIQKQIHQQIDMNTRGETIAPK
jgi:capsular polysaccharide biosynthesis protein